jgi:membrane-bound ClpP family serine protease
MGVSVALIGVAVTLWGFVGAITAAPTNVMQQQVQELRAIEAAIGLAIFGLGVCAAYLSDIAKAVEQKKERAGERIEPEAPPRPERMHPVPPV